MNEGLELFDNFGGRPVEREVVGQPRDACIAEERPSINNGRETPPDQNQQEILSSGEMSTPAETRNAGERPRLSSSPESPGTSTWLEASEQGSQLESQPPADSASRLGSAQDKRNEAALGDKASSPDRFDGPPGQPVDPEIIPKLIKASSIDRVSGAGTKWPDGYHLVPGIYDGFMNFTYIANTPYSAIVERNGQYFQVKPDDIAAYARNAPIEKGVLSARWVAVAYPWLVKKVGQGISAAGGPYGAIAGTFLDALGEKGIQEAAASEEYQRYLKMEQGELYELPPISIAMGTVELTKAQQFVQRISEVYKEAVAKFEAEGIWKPPEIGRKAEKYTLERVPQELTRLKMNPRAVEVGNVMVGATGPKGGQVTVEILSRYYNFMIELKKSPEANRGWQAQAQQIAAKEVFTRPMQRYVLYGQRGRGKSLIEPPICPRGR